MTSSTDGEKVNNSNDKRSNPNNPFIQFRQFADAQISTLLQGIIGLPSALSKGSSDDGRWTGFDDTLGRRDELQERRRELKESEAQKSRRLSDEEESRVQIRDRAYLTSKEYVSLENRSEDRYPLTKDLPLYSAVTESLFSHLRRPELDDAGWKDLRSPTLWLGNSGASRELQKSKLTHSGQVDMEVTQSLIYKDLHTNDRLISEYSLLPYLLFSPYSPLRLSSAGSEEPLYSEAFEDLIVTTRPECRDSYWKHVVAKMIGSRMNSHMDHVEWIQKLRAFGYLQERETVDVCTTDRSLISLLSTVLNEEQQLECAFKNMVRPRSPQANSPHSSKTIKLREGSERQTDDCANPETEQEMYDQFLNWISSSSQIIKESIQAVDAFVASLENGEISGRRREEQDDASRPPSIMEEVLALTKGFRDLARDTETPSEATQSDERPEVMQPESPDRVVSSSTMTEKTVCEDGKVLTSVTVWKRYSSGRETTTTTENCGNPAVTATKQPTEHQDSNSRGSEKVIDEVERKKKTGGSGWFWN